MLNIYIYIYIYIYTHTYIHIYISFKGFETKKQLICYHTISVCTCFWVCICLMFRFAYLAYYCFSAMLFSVSHSSIVNIFCCLCYVPGVFLKSPMLCLRCVCCLLFSKTRQIAQYLTCGFCDRTTFCDLRILV